MAEVAYNLIKSESFYVRALIADQDREAAKGFFEIFTVPIRNENPGDRTLSYHGSILPWARGCATGHFTPGKDPSSSSGQLSILEKAFNKLTSACLRASRNSVLMPLLPVRESAQSLFIKRFFIFAEHCG